MVIGVDIGGTKVAAGVVTLEGAVLERLERPTPIRGGPDAVVEVAAGLVRDLRLIHPSVGAVGVGSAGLVDSTRGVVVEANNLPGFRGLALGERLRAAVGLQVAVTNDVSAAALAETRLGAGRGARSVLMVMVGTGIGGALILDGQIYQGARGLGGEVGHMTVAITNGRLCPCGRRGCLEAYAAGRAIEVAYGAASGDTGVSVPEVTRRARGGDRVARSVLAAAGRAFGLALGNLANALNPDTIVLGGGVFGAGTLYTDAMDSAMQQQAFPASYAALTVRRAELGAEAVLVGAALLVL